MTGTVAGEVASAVREGKKAPIALLSVALVVALVLLGWERFHGEKKTDAMLDRWTGGDHRAYAAEQDTRVKALERNAATVTEALDNIRREQTRQGAQLERVLDRLPPR